MKDSKIHSLARLFTFPMTLAIASTCSPQVVNNTPAGSVNVIVDVAAKRHPISPLVYGVNFATPAQAKALNLRINRNGGNGTTRYNWMQNATNSGNDWFFLSHPDDEKHKKAAPGTSVIRWVQNNRALGVQSMVTIPMIGWTAKLKPDRSRLWSYSVAKYGAQQKTEPFNKDMGNGFKPDGTPITGNDPNDANQPAPLAFEKEWVQRLVKTFGPASRGGTGFYLLDNEPALWNSTHRDVFPHGATMDDLFARQRATAAMIKSVDPTALVAGPEEWGWTGYLYSARDSEWASKNGWTKPKPDRTAHNNMDIAPWFLRQFAQAQKKTGKRLLDVFTLHYYPQGEKESGDDVSEATQLRRNRSTRSLWDKNYIDQSWIKTQVMLIPRMKQWVRAYYPGTKIGITEYSWGAEKHISGAIAQADVLGILGRESVDLATRWTCPATDSPAFKAIQMYRNYDGKGGTFGDISVSSETPNPDTLASFAAQDKQTGTVTVQLINKQIHAASRAKVSLDHFAPTSSAIAYRLTGTNRIERLPNMAIFGKDLSVTLPPQSITLLVVRKRP